MSVPDAGSNAAAWIKALREGIDSGAHVGTIHDAIDALEALLADRVDEVERLTVECNHAIGRAEAAERVVRGARSLWGSWAFCAPEALGQMAAYKIGGPLSEYADLEKRPTTIAD